MVRCKSRWYDSSVGRFLQQDSVFGSMTNPTTQNLYAYVRNNPVNMWDPSGHVPSWVESRSNHIVNQYTKTAYYDSNGDGKKDNWYYTEYYKDWYQFNSYSKTWGAVQYQGRSLYSFYYEKHYKQDYTEVWNYTHRIDRHWEVDFTGPENQNSSSSATYSNSGFKTWSNKVYYSDLNKQHEQLVSQQYGQPPGDTNRDITFSNDRAEMSDLSSMNGVSGSAQLLLADNHDVTIESAQQKIHFAAYTEYTQPQINVVNIVNTIPDLSGISSSFAPVASPDVSLKGFGSGLLDSGKDAVTGLCSLIRHPINSGENIYRAVSHPITTGKAIWNGVSTAYKDQVINGDANTRGHFFGYAVGEIALAVVGTKGLDKVRFGKGRSIWLNGCSSSK